jgi:hypothetical protein
LLIGLRIALESFEGRRPKKREIDRRTELLSLWLLKGLRWIRIVKNHSWLGVMWVRKIRMKTCGANDLARMGGMRRDM